jgi:hypothetical protein
MGGGEPQRPAVPWTALLQPPVLPRWSAGLPETLVVGWSALR